MVNLHAEKAILDHKQVQIPIPRAANLVGENTWRFCVRGPKEQREQGGWVGQGVFLTSVWKIFEQKRNDYLELLS